MAVSGIQPADDDRVVGVQEDEDHGQLEERRRVRKPAAEVAAAPTSMAAASPKVMRSSPTILAELEAVLRREVGRADDGADVARPQPRAEGHPAGEEDDDADVRVPEKVEGRVGMGDEVGQRARALQPGAEERHTEVQRGKDGSEEDEVLLDADGGGDSLAETLPVHLHGAEVYTKGHHDFAALFPAHTHTRACARHPGGRGRVAVRGRPRCARHRRDRVARCRDGRCAGAAQSAGGRGGHPRPGHGPLHLPVACGHRAAHGFHDQDHDGQGRPGQRPLAEQGGDRRRHEPGKRRVGGRPQSRREADHRPAAPGTSGCQRQRLRPHPRRWPWAARSRHS